MEYLELLFQESDTAPLEGLEELDYFVFYLAITLFTVILIIISLMLNYRKSIKQIIDKNRANICIRIKIQSTIVLYGLVIYNLNIYSLELLYLISVPLVSILSDIFFNKKELNINTILIL